MSFFEYLELLGLLAAFAVLIVGLLRLLTLPLRLATPYRRSLQKPPDDDLERKRRMEMLRVLREATDADTGRAVATREIGDELQARSKIPWDEEAIGRVFRFLEHRGWADVVDPRGLFDAWFYGPRRAGLTPEGLEEVERAMRNPTEATESRASFSDVLIAGDVNVHPGAVFGAVAGRNNAIGQNPTINDVAVTQLLQLIEERISDPATPQPERDGLKTLRGAIGELGESVVANIL